MYYLHIIDEFSRFSQAGIGRSKKTSEIIEVLSQKWISVYGCSSLIFSDNGGEFCSKEFEDWTQNFNIEHKTSAAYSPFSNGIVERHNAVISLMMLKLVEEFPNTKVDTILSWACSAKTHSVLLLVSHPISSCLGRRHTCPMSSTQVHLLLRMKRQVK